MSVLGLLAADSVPLEKLNDPRLWDVDGHQYMTLAGEAVSPSGSRSLSAYFAGIRAIAEDVAKLPFPVYRELGRGGKEKLPAHPVARILKRSANPTMNALRFRELMTGWALGWGNAFAEKEFGPRGELRALWPIHPSRVTIENGVDRGSWFYRISLESGSPLALSRDRVFHLRGLGDDDKVGISIARAAANSLGLAAALERYASRFFANGANIRGVLSHPGAMSPEAVAALREQWEKMYSGPSTSHKTAILLEGMKFERVSVAPGEAQFIESRRFSIEEIARWFRIPPHKIGHLERATFSNIEHQSLEYVVDCLLPWLRRWEEEVLVSLIEEDADDGVFAEHVVEGLLRGDTRARGEFYQRMMSIGALSPNEIREKENMNPVEGGDERFIPLNMTLLSAPELGRPAPRGQQRASSPPEGERRRPPRAAESDRREIAESMLPILEDAGRRCARKEISAVGRAEKRYSDPAALRSWLVDFYREQSETVSQAFAAPVAGLGRILGVSLVFESIAGGPLAELEHARDDLLAAPEGVTSRLEADVEGRIARQARAVLDAYLAEHGRIGP